MPTLVQLIYVHGFQGNDTTFQSFPKHLQEHISTHIPAHLDVTFQSTLYPTYKSVKPITYAIRNFLEWLHTQPPGPVILLGHSMGGLLAADAATDVSNNLPGHKPKRIVGVIAFDTPYLGMHPHVVITGIASLLPKSEEEKKEKTEEAMNDHPQVNIVEDKVTDDWEGFKKREHIHPGRPPISSSASSAYSHSSALSNHTGRSLSPPPSPFMERAIGFIANHADEPVVRWLRKHADEPFSAGRRWIVDRFQFGICMFDPPGLKSRYENLVEWQGGKWVNYWTETVPKARKGKAVEGSETSSESRGSTSSSAGRLDNDQALVANGMISESAATDKSTEAATKGKSSEPPYLTEPSDPPPVYEASVTPIAENPSVDEHSESLTLGAPTKSEHTAAQKQSDKEKKQEEKRILKEKKDEEKRVNLARKEEEQKAKKEEQKMKKEQKELAKELKRQEKENKPKPARHFVVLPNGLGEFLGGYDKWEKVPIGGVEDEVGAHLGLFIPEHNHDYDGLVANVANRILGWCENLPKTR